MSRVFMSSSRSALALLLVGGAALCGSAEAVRAQGWNGFYAGLNAGYTWGGDGVETTGTSLAGPTGINANMDTAQRLFSARAAQEATFSGPNGPNSFIGGGQLGHNWQVSGTFVAGLEVDLQWLADNSQSKAATRDTGSFTATPFGAITTGSIIQSTQVSKSIDYIGTARVRAGYLVTPTTLAYITGGVAFGHVAASTSITQSAITDQLGPSSSAVGAGSVSDTRFGWTIGGGIEWGFARNWSFKSEYLYYDLGSVDYALTRMTSGNVAAGAPLIRIGASSSVDFTGHIARLGINHKF